MIGLEGSGFTICLGVILLLTGIVMYYCKSKITQNEHKINSMFKLVTALHEEVNQLKANQQHQQTVASNHEAMQNQESWNQTSNEEPQESSMNEETPMPTSFLNHPYEELIPPQLTEELEESEDSQSETDNEENLQLNLTNDNSDSSIKVVDLGEIEELKVEEESDEESEEADNTESEAESEAESPPIDYSKMQVAALKKIVSERKLATNVGRLKKQELLNLLQV